MNLGDLRPRFRLADFFVRICRAKALLAFIFPVPVFLKRFAAPRFVFIFGTLSSFWADPNDEISSPNYRLNYQRPSPKLNYLIIEYWDLFGAGNLVLGYLFQLFFYPPPSIGEVEISTFC